MEYNEGDNEGKDDEVGDVPQVGANEGESCQSRAKFFGEIRRNH